MTTKNNELRQVMFGMLKQGEMSIETYYEKIKSSCEKLKYSSEDTKLMFIDGLTLDNRREACGFGFGVEIPLDLLVDILKRIEHYKNISLNANNSKSNSNEKQNQNEIYIRQVVRDELKKIVNREEN